MRLRRKPTGQRFFDLFSTVGTNISGSVEILRQFMLSPSPELRAQMRSAEHAGDDATHDIIDLLNRSFVTPFDREDIYRLAIRLDDVVDHMDAAVDFVSLYVVESLPEGVHAQVELLGKAARLTAEAMPQLATPGDLSSYWVEVNELENEADQVHRQLLSTLFSGKWDTLTVMKLKEIVDELESAADAFEHVADVVHTIAVKES